MTESICTVDKIYQYVVMKKYPPGLSKNDKSNLRKLSKRYLSKDGDLYYMHQAKRTKTSDDISSETVRELRVISNTDEQQGIIAAAHCGDDIEDLSQSRHLGVMKTQDKILQTYYWKGVSADVRSFISRCEQCQIYNPLHDKHPQAMQQMSNMETLAMPVADGVMKFIDIDIIDLPATEEGFRCLVLAIDYFSKWPEARALKDKTAENIARFLYEDIVCRHGCVDIQIHDQGPEFVDKITEELLPLTSTKLNITSVYHLHSDLTMEGPCKSLREILLKCLGSQENWPSCLHGLIFAYRTSTHPLTNQSPFALLYGREHKLSSDCVATPTSIVQDSTVGECSQPSASHENSDSWSVDEQIQQMLGQICDSGAHK